MQASSVIGSTIPPAATDLTSKAMDLNKNDFLTLLMTQMQNQDPLNPMDNTAFLSQLAQFSQLEQAYNLSQSVQDIVASQNSSRDMMLAGLLGKTAKVDASTIYLKGQDNTSIKYDLVDSADKVTLKIYDADSNPVRTVSKEQQPSGQYTIEWDGKDDKGKNLPEGEYTVEITADNKGVESWLSPYLIGAVNEVTFSQGNEPLLKVENQSVPISKILQFSMSSNQVSSDQANNSQTSSDHCKTNNQ